MIYICAEIKVTKITHQFTNLLRISDGQDIALSPAGFVDVNDKTGFSLSSPQNFNLIGNISGTFVGNISGTVGAVNGLNPNYLDTYVSSRMPSGTVVVGDKTGFSLSNPQVFDLIGNITGTIVGNISGSVGAVQVVNDKIGYFLGSPQRFDLIGNVSGTWMGNISGTVGVVNGLVPSRLDVNISSRMATGTLVDANVQQWKNQIVLTPNVTGTPKVDLVDIDGLATNGNNATLNLKHLNIQNNAGNAISASSTGGGGSGLVAQGQGGGSGIVANGGASGDGFEANGGSTSGNGVKVNSSAIGYAGVNIVSSQNDGIYIDGALNGIQIVADGNGDGIWIQANGTGKSINAPQGILGDIIGNITGTFVGDIWGNITGTSGIRTGTFIEAMADQVWDEQIGGHLITGSTGKKLSDAGSAGDPWGTSLPAAYTPGQAGYILGTNLNDRVTSRMPSGTIPTASQIAAETLSQATSNPIDSNVKQVNDVGLQGDGSTTPWGPV